jgi:D-alanyl-D-alanine carboxypeptidase
LKGEDNFIKTDSYRYIHYGHKGFSLGVANGKLSSKSYSGLDGSAGTFYCRAIIIPDTDVAFYHNDECWFGKRTNEGSGLADNEDYK